MDREVAGLESRVVILTLAKHAGDVWVTALVDRLRAAAPLCVVEVTAVEEAQLDPVGGLGCDVLVNRVSDAAPPALVKATMMMLMAAELEGIRVINSAAAYSVGANKALHHVALTRAGLQSPATVVCRSLPPTASQLAQLTFPILLKPNSGGFGAGISRFDSVEDLLAAIAAKEVDLGDERVVLLQDLVQPEDLTQFRVWFCGGRVQCAVKVEWGGDSFAGACMAGSCQAHNNKKAALSVEAWSPPDDVVSSVKRVMSVVGADVGSVELLYPASKQELGTHPAPLYFDINMLSTLPACNSTEDPQGVWPPSFDPWYEMALHVLSGSPKL